MIGVIAAIFTFYERVRVLCALLRGLIRGESLPVTIASQVKSRMLSIERRGASQLPL